MNFAAIARATLGACVLLLALSQVACVGISPTQTYRLVDLGTLDCHGTNGCYVANVNDWCEVAGWDVLASGEQNAYVWRPAAAGNPIRIQLPYPQLKYDPGWDRYGTPQGTPWVALQSALVSTGLRAYRINNFGEVIGAGSGPRNEAILWATRSQPQSPAAQRSAQTAYLGELPLGGSASNAYGINDELQIAGSSDITAGKHAIYFSPWLGMIDLKDLPHGTATDYAEATAVGEGAQVVGTGKAAAGNHAFYWFLPIAPPPAPPPTIVLQDLGDLPGGANDSSATAVSRWDIVIGKSGVPNGNHAFEWEKATNMMRDLGDLPGGAEASVAYAIQDTMRDNSGAPAKPGDIVGSGTSASGAKAVGWPAPAVAGMPYGAPINLNTLVSPPATSVTLVEAKGINRFGVISARGLDAGVNHVYLLVPSGADVADASGTTPYQQFCVGPISTP